MFDVAPSELLIVAIVALVVIGPKDLPKAMRFVGQWVAKARGMARHFRSGLDTMMREAELEEIEAKWREHNAAIMAAHPLGAPDPQTATAVISAAAPTYLNGGSLGSEADNNGTSPPVAPHFMVPATHDGASPAPPASTKTARTKTARTKSPRAKTASTKTTLAKATSGNTTPAKATPGKTTSGKTTSGKTTPARPPRQSAPRTTSARTTSPRTNPAAAIATDNGTAK